MGVGSHMEVQVQGKLEAERHAFATTSWLGPATLFRRLFKFPVGPDGLTIPTSLDPSMQAASMGTLAGVLCCCASCAYQLTSCCP